jgi:hypothetical protein
MYGAINFFASLFKEISFDPEFSGTFPASRLNTTDNPRLSALITATEGLGT